MSDYIASNLYTKLNFELLDSQKINYSSLNVNLKKLKDTHSEEENQEKLSSIMENMKYNIPQTEAVDNFIAVLNGNLNDLENVFFDSGAGVVEFIKKTDAKDLVYNEKDRIFDSNDCGSNFVVYSKKAYKGKRFRFSFQADLTITDSYYSGFGILDEAQFEKGTSWPESDKSCYLNVSQLKMNNMECSNTDDLKKEVKDGKLEFRVDVNGPSDTMTLTCGSVVVKKATSFSIKDKEIRFFFLIYKGGMKKIKILK